MNFFEFFYKFNSIYFELNSFKLFILSHADMADDVVWTKYQCHMATSETKLCHILYMCAHV